MLSPVFYAFMAYTVCTRMACACACACTCRACLSALCIFFYWPSACDIKCDADATCLYFLPLGLVASPPRRLVPCTASECLVLTKFGFLLTYLTLPITYEPICQSCQATKHLASLLGTNRLDSTEGSGRGHIRYGDAFALPLYL